MGTGQSCVVVAVATTLTVLLAGCGSSGAKDNGESAKQAAQVVADAKAASVAASTVHISGTGTTNGQPLVLDLYLVAGKGGRGKLTVNGLTFQIVRVGQNAYFKGDSAFWRNFGGAAAAALLQGRWLEAPADSGRFASFTPLTDIGKLFAALFASKDSIENSGKTTLDGASRTLDPSMLVIADGQRAHAIAGVIGGRDSEITPDTRDVFLEVATFDAKRVRAARRSLGVSTDAAFRFERSVPPTSPEETFAIAVQLILTLAGGEASTPAVVVAAPQSSPRPIQVRATRVAQVLGVPVAAEECRSLLATVGFAATVKGSDVQAIAPPWRIDVVAEIDLVEEIARLRGYGSFPDELRPYRLGTVPDDPLVARSARLRELLVGRGFIEVRPMPFVAGVASDAAGVRVTNPLADTEAYLRGELLPSLARRAEFNLAHMVGDLRLFEIGTVFLPVPGDARPREEVRVAALCMGGRRPPHFTEPSPPQWDEWDVKGIGEAVARAARADGPFVVEPAGGGADLWTIRAGGHPVGRIVTVPLDAPPWAAPAFGLEVTISVTESAPVAPPGQHAAPATGPVGRPRQGPRFTPPPTQPPVRVDVTLLVPDALAADKVEQLLGSGRESLVERVELQSEYRGPSVPAGYRSLTWRLTFRHPERTLREKEVEARRDKLLRALESELGVRQRTT